MPAAISPTRNFSVDWKKIPLPCQTSPPAWSGFLFLPIGRPPFLLRPSSLLLTGVALVVICSFAALLGIIKVARLEPAIVFRG